MSLLVKRIAARQEDIHRWLESLEGANELPLYSSVDIRDSGFKTAVVDTNIFPGGFNNLCEHGREDASGFMRAAILKRVPDCKNILIVAEEHTRNTWYLENVRILQEIIRRAGFQVKAATFLTVRPEFCSSARSVDLATAAGETVTIYCFRRILEDYRAGKERHCLIILNNDLTAGIPEVLRQSTVPIYPSAQAGWHSRLKSRHFDHANELLEEFSRFIDLDPWFVSCLHSPVDRVDINEPADRRRLADAASDLLNRVRAKYAEHGLGDKPYLVIKPDSGTYGMGVLPVEDAGELLDLNNRNRAKLHKGKSSRVISRFLLQEGVPTIYNVNNKVSEVVFYQIENNQIGGFYRSHSGKGRRENLNSSGMEFHKICPRQRKYGECGPHDHWTMFDVYRVMARIAGIAAHREIVQLESDRAGQ
jgi:glutamate--cysteine ligase